MGINQQNISPAVKSSARKVRRKIHYEKSQVLVEMIEIAVAVQQPVPFFNAKRCHKAINCVADRHTHASKNAIVEGGLNRKLSASRLENRKPAHCGQGGGKPAVFPDSLQHFRQD
jgi:hypothetical protein